MHRFTRLALLGLFVLGISSPKISAAVFGAKKTWCDSGLSREPRELAIFKQDLKPLKGIKTFNVDYENNHSRNAEYETQIRAGIDNLFKQPRYQGATPELKARLISYLLVKWIVIPTTRSSLFVQTSSWLNEILDSEPGFSVADLERLRLSYAIFAERRARFTARHNGRNVLPGFWTVMGDGALTAAANLIFHSALESVVPGLSILPLPVTIAIVTFRNVSYRNKGDPLDPAANEVLLKTENRFYQLIGSHLPVDSQISRWDVSLKSIEDSAGGLKKAGLLRQLTNDSCEVVANAKEPNLANAVSLFTHMAESMKSVNPFEWQEIYESFKIIRATAIRIKVAESAAQPVFRAMEEVSQGWTANAAARQAVGDFLKTNYAQQALPSQDPAVLEPK
jgi:hypothetical protein